MKQKLGIIVVLLAFAAILTIALIHDSKADAAGSPEEAIKTTVLAYLNSVNSGDIDTMVEYTDDLRFPDKSIQKQNYEGLKQPVTDIVIKGMEPLTPTSYKVDFSATINGATEDLALQVVNKYDKWLVVIGQQQQQ